ncbi:hypothetical protein JKP88DRAFT_262780 [Tribonema minus]|uniref:Pentatricopeptide repeat-containing protein n=1 Tax=Tribonema minus TaxID=303371 RepID=A0A835Z0G4_9STRA|nr:hypothetical protein JKP88DRAFT_262780 [Tribonema minus]
MWSRTIWRCMRGAAATPCKNADRILASMAAAGVAPDRHTFVGVLRACRLAQDWRRAIDVFFNMEANHPEFADVQMWNRLLKVVYACAAPESTLEVAALMAERGVVPITATYNAVLGAHAMRGDSVAVQSVLSSMRAVGEQVTFATLATLAKGYAHGGHWDAAEEALEAVLNSDRPTPVRVNAVTAFVHACGRARDLPRIVRWLRRLPSLGLAPTPRMWDVAVSAAHEGGDAAAADAMWREAGGAAYFGLYKVLVPLKEGAKSEWTVQVDHPAQQEHAPGAALDLSSCRIGAVHAALRAEVTQLRAQPPPAVRSFFSGAGTPELLAIAAAIGAVMEEAGMSANKAISSNQLRAIMRAAARAGQQELVRTALKQLTDAGLATSQDWAHLVHAHVAARNAHDAELTLGEMVAIGHKPEMAVFHAVLRAKAKYLHKGGASVVLRRMAQSGTPPDLTAYNLALHTCSGGSAVLHADKILADMAAMGLAPNRHTFRGMLRACRMAQDWERALAVFGSVEAHYPAYMDTDLWICLLDALSVCRQPQAVLEAAARMAERGLPTTAAVHVVIAKAHAELGDGAAAETALSSMRAAGLKVTEVALFKVAEGYAHGRHVDASEQALEAAFRSSSTGAAATAAHMHAILAFMGACRHERDLPRALRWLQRLPSLGVALSPRVVEVVVTVAHNAGDDAETDKLWREAGGAAYFGLYKALVQPEEGGRRGWTVLLDHPVRRPHAQSTALDLSSCNDVMMHVALRAEAEWLRTQPPSATAYTYAYTPKSVERAGVFHALVEHLGMHISAVPGATGLFKASVCAQEQAQ